MFKNRCHICIANAHVLVSFVMYCVVTLADISDPPAELFCDLEIQSNRDAMLLIVVFAAVVQQGSVLWRNGGEYLGAACVSIVEHSRRELSSLASVLKYAKCVVRKPRRQIPWIEII